MNGGAQFEIPDFGFGPMALRSPEALAREFPKLREPLIDGLLRVGETMNVISAPKVGKSWIVCDLALAVAAGRPWLGQFATTQGVVWILDNELHGETSSDRFPIIARKRGLAEKDYADRLFVANLRGQRVDIDGLEPYFDWVLENRKEMPRIVVLDAFYKFLPEGTDENNNGDMARVYSKIDAYAMRLGCSFILIHHSTKGSQSAKAVTDVGAGAGAQSRATDTHLVLRPHEEEGVVVVDAAVRSWKPVNPFCLRLDFPVFMPDRFLDPRLLRPDGPTRRRRERAEDKVEAPQPWSAQRFVDELIGGRTVTTSELDGAATLKGITHRSAKQLRDEAESGGLIERVKVAGRGGPVTFRRASCEALDLRNP